MSEHVSNDDQLDAARKEIVLALGRYADGWNTSEGGVVTQFVCLAEVATPSGAKALIEVVGSGHDGSGYVARWARNGMLFDALYVPSPEADEA